MPGRRTRRRRRKNPKSTEKSQERRGREADRFPAPFSCWLTVVSTGDRKGARENRVLPSAGSCHATSRESLHPNEIADCSSCQAGCSGIFWPCPTPLNTALGEEFPNPPIGSPHARHHWAGNHGRNATHVRVGITPLLAPRCHHEQVSRFGRSSARQETVDWAADPDVTIACPPLARMATDREMDGVHFGTCEARPSAFLLD